MTDKIINLISEHYKDKYTILTKAFHTQTKQILIIYKDLETSIVYAEPAEILLSKLNIKENNI
ncbi:MAG: hypothetical protein HUJ68_07720 [Clostridia bacterium]|nr:hypothetical protein [Clostridia bacterium]